jgi:hypothetical protein
MDYLISVVRYATTHTAQDNRPIRDGIRVGANKNSSDIVYHYRDQLIMFSNHLSEWCVY